jgi:hypothetical protein
MFVLNVLSCAFCIVTGYALGAVVNALVACELGHQLWTWREFRR